MSVRGSWWSLTLNNPTAEDRATLLAPIDSVLETAYQDEIGANGTLHIQGCIRTIYMRMAQLKDWLPRAHWEVCRNKNALQNYVKKKETGVPGTFIQWRRNPNDDSGDYPPEEASLTFVEVMRFLAARALMQPGQTAEDVYHSAVNSIYEDRPNLLSQITAARILPAWKILFDSLLTEAIYIHENIVADDDDDTWALNFWEGLDAPAECPVCNLEVCDCRPD